jgi:hypothetical protein
MSSKRRDLRKAWERKGYTVVDNAGHGRVLDRAGRLVATFALTPGSQRSQKLDWRKLSKPIVPWGIDRSTGAAG